VDRFGHGKADVKTQNKHKVFCWLLLRNRLSSRELLRKKNMELEDHSCVLCDSSSDETLVHLLFLLKNQLQVPFFMEIIILMCWTIWN